MSHPTRAVELQGEVDAYFEDHLIGDDPVLASAIARAADAGLPDHHVSPAQGQLLGLLVRMMDARRVLEIGTLAGYSTVCMARALGAGGTLTTLEVDTKAAEVATQSFQEAGLSDRIFLRHAPAVESLDEMVRLGEPAFDFVFIDADKSSNALYLERVLQLVEPGSAIFADNIVRNAALVSDDPLDKRPRRDARDFVDALGAASNLLSTGIQTLGGKGYDGFTLSVVV